MFDSIINEAGEKFNLGSRAGTLLSALLALMTDGTRGGLAGFLKRFNRAGLGDTAASWVNSGSNTPLSNEQLESALGSDTLDEIANRAGINYQATTSAAAYLIPRMVNTLTPDGVIPESSDMTSRISEYSTSASETTGATMAETFDRIGTAASATLDAGTRNVGGPNADFTDVRNISERPNIPLNRINDNFVDDEQDNSPFKWLLPLLLLGLLLTLGYTFCSKTPVPTATTVNVNTVNVNTNAANQ